MKPRVIVVVALVVGSLTGLLAWRWANGAGRDQGTPSATAAETTTAPLDLRAAPVTGATPTSTTEARLPRRVGYVVTRSGTQLSPGPAQDGFAVAAGIVLPVLAEVGGGYRVMDTCNVEGWVAADDVDAAMVPDGSPDRFDESVFVIDPGHGLPDYGAIGPSGLSETEVNLDVSSRLSGLLRSPHDIDWQTRVVTPGDAVPAAAVAVLTRDPDGPNGGDYQLGLAFRATVANAVDATALVSIHHNTAPETTLDHPGAEAFVSASNPESPRLGGLIVEELRIGFSQFEADWTGSTGNGLVARVDPDGSDYYSVLERSEVPAAIVEGAYISNPTEEALALTDAFRQAYAEGVYRALVRFVTTEDSPLPPPEPIVWDVDRPAPSMSDCEVPTP